MENLTKIVNYIQEIVNPDSSNEMSSPPSTSSGCISGTSEDDHVDHLEKAIDSFCNVSAETYLTLPEEILSLTTTKELETAINHCKAMILERTDDSNQRKWLVRRLIELRLRLETIKEMKHENAALENLNQNNKVLLGHHFIFQNQPLSTAKYYCDRCSGIIWNVIHTWYLCTECEYRCHVRCLSRVSRICAHVLVTENPKYVTEICPEPENGLAEQNYRCAECLRHTSFRDSALEPRLCEYNGKYYCPTCHWNSACVIPARIIHNWDFKERRVCRSSKQILKLMAKLPILKLEELNPVLFATIEELIEIKLLRQHLLQIKKYLITCKAALESRLLWQLDDRRHFIENENTYSMQDLIDIRSGELLQYLNKLRDGFIKHIKNDCQICYGRGYCCELCTDEKVIFPFDSNIISCSKCQSAFHFSCWVKINQQCRKCDRIQKRLEQSSPVES